MTTIELVQVWAERSRNLWSELADEHGPHILVQHDALLEGLKSELKHFYQPCPDVSTFVAMMAARNLLRSDDDLDPASRVLIDQRLQLYIGLVAEAIFSTRDNIVFSAMVSVGGARKKEVEMTTSLESVRGVFSCSPTGDVWRPTGFGLTPVGERTNLRGRHHRLDVIVRRVLSARPEGGRFEITDRGVFLKDGLRKVA